MKKSKTLAIEYSGLSSNSLTAIKSLDAEIREFLMKDGLVLYKMLDVLGCGGGSKNRLSNIIVRFGNAVVEYDSHRTINKEETEIYAHSINLHILSETPGKAADYIKHHLFAPTLLYKEEEYDEILTPFMLGTEQLFLSAYSREERDEIYRLLTSGRSALYEKADGHFFDKEIVDKFADVLVEKIRKVQNAIRITK
ncbi:MAG: hypothetical protein Q7J54_07780 [Candidatus Woesearchaeota archaeon]|nr:hypothetical protein [Candidatus Woesearchaeota archaeon]